MEDRRRNRGERRVYEREELLWQLAGLPTGASRGAPCGAIDDATIERYRRGEMPGPESQRVETRLAGDEEAMDRMARLAQRISRRRRAALRFAASILVAATATLALFLSLRRGGGEDVSEIPQYTVSVEGAAERRGAAPAAGLSYDARPGSLVRIVARPATTPRSGLAFVLYRDLGDTLVLVAPAEAAIRVHRGTAVIEAEAERLVGTEPGRHALVLVVGGERLRVPETLARIELDALVARRGLETHPIEIVLLPADGAERPATASRNLSWELYAAPCRTAVSRFSQSCGAYGELHFDVVSSSCDAIDSGAGIPLGYPGPRIGESAVGETEARARGFAGGRELPREAPASGPWGAVIDWRNPHGIAVGAVTDALSGPDVPTIGYYLDDSTLRPLGSEVGDQHLLVKLCQVAEDVETHAAADLETLGLSLGRVGQPGDPSPGGSCRGTLACQIEGVMRHLRDRGVHIAAAAGNHRELLFPARLDETLAVGALDFGHYLATGRLQAAWESPTSYDALLPGHALCVDGETAPSGSSLSTAFFAGGLARLLVERPGVDPYDGGLWSTEWSTREDCMVLTQGGHEHSFCNRAIEDVLRGILRGDSGGCWDSPDPALVVTAASPSEALPQPPSPALPRWFADRLTANPEEGPCIPCSDDDAYPPFSADLFLNLTRSMPLSADLSVDSLYLRAGSSFYEIELGAQELAGFAGAELDGMLLPGFASLLTPDGSPSLFYLLKADPALDCSDPADADDCFWSSTQILP